TPRRRPRPAPVPYTTLFRSVNQRETHPFNQQIATRELLARHGTALQAWGPLGQGSPEILGHAVLAEIAEEHRRSVPQVILRWHRSEEHTSELQSRFDLVCRL